MTTRKHQVNLENVSTGLEFIVDSVLSTKKMALLTLRTLRNMTIRSIMKSLLIKLLTNASKLILVGNIFHSYASN